MSESETLTGATGQFAFTGLRAGSYTIEISGFDNEDVGFGSTSSTAQLAVGESRVVNFEGTYLRASAIMGQVSVEGTGLGGVTVSLQGKGETREMTTNGAGQFMFEDLRRGDYAIGISGYDDDEYGFDVTSKTVMVPYGETENVPFEGTALRTAEVGGTVTVEGMGPLEGVTVSLSGKGDDPDPVVTLGDGRFSFERLHAGDYTISIFGFDTDEYGFDVTSENVTVALKGTATVEFGGIMLRTAAIEGAVTVKGGALPGVTVTVSGGPKGEEHTATTNGAGMYGVDELHAGDYSVAISGYDTREYGFEVTTKPVSVGLRETADVAFDGILLRTAGVSGRVTVDGEAMSGLTVTLSGEEDRTGMTGSDGQYAFSELAAGDYMLALSGYDEAEYEFPASMSVPLELDEAAIANFEGRSLRTVVIMGTVSAEGDALEGVAVTLIKVLSATSGEVLDQMPTDEDGGYMFDELLAGIYRVDLGPTDDEYDFPAKTRMGAVATDETAMWDFPATIIRTASVGGMVTVDGDGMADVMVMLSGDRGTDMDMETASDGGYAFEGLRKGGYTVSIVNPDADMYDFPTTSRMVSLAVGQAQGDVSFAGSMLRRASISGQVHVEGTGLKGVTVTLEGDMEGEMTTDDNGEYNFPGLAGGDYSVSIENPDADAYTFADMEIDVDDLGDEEAKIVDFAGEHTATASVSGVLFADEVDNDGMYTDGEPVLPFGEFPLLLQGPGLHQVTLGATDATGAFSFDALKAGQYNLVVNLPGGLKATLARRGYNFTGELINTIDVPAATELDVNFPFRITKQTIHVGALLANKRSTSFPVGGVTMKLYPTAEDAEDGTNTIGSEATDTVRRDRPNDPHVGFAEFEFDRAEDKGPGGGPIDYLVFAKVTGVKNSDLVVHDERLIEIEYEAVEREIHAPEAVKLINTRVNFQWRVKSNEAAKDGNRFLGGWEDKNYGKKTNSYGLATYSDTVTTSQMASLIAARKVYFRVEMKKDQAELVDMGERWKQSSRLVHTHTGLENPATNTKANNDLGPIYVTWTTQTLVLGFYREADDVEGFTNYKSGLPGGDHRPSDYAADDIRIQLRAPDSRGRHDVYEWDHDDDLDTDSVSAGDFEIVDGLVKYPGIPADVELSVRLLDIGDDRLVVTYPFTRNIDAFDDDVYEGMTIGAFGDESGAGPVVWLCPASAKEGRDSCATFGYQWTNGEVSAKFRSRAGKDARYTYYDLDEEMKLVLEAKTDNHGAEGDEAKTKNKHTFDELQDGTYTISTEPTDKYEVDGNSVFDVHVFYDEAGGNSAYEEDVEFKVTDLDPPPPPKNNDATLASLTLDGVDLNPGFDPAVGEYTAEVGPSVGTIAVMWGTTDSNATTDPASSPHTFTLDDPGDRTDLTITVTAEDGETTKTYNVEVKRAAATDDAHLEGSLTLKLNDDNGTVVILAIEKDETDYTTDVPAAVDEVEVMWTTNDEYATTDPAESPHTLELDDVGEAESLEITVTASDGETKRTYTLTVDRAADLSNNATLASLSLSPGVLNQDFDPEEKVYTADVGPSVEEVTVTFATADGSATTDPVSSPHTLELGDAGTDTPLDITVTAEDGETTETYTITVTRAERPVSNNATLASLSLSPGVLNQDFDPEEKVYTADVGSSVEEVTVTFATADGSATTDPVSSPHTLELGDAGTDTPLDITVTAEDGETTETYTITVTRAERPVSNNATLASLSLSPGVLNQDFDPEEKVYTADVGSSVEEVTVTFATADGSATTDPVSSPHTLELGDAGTETPLDITVTAEDGETTERYTITVTRATEPGKNNDANLASLTLDGVDLNQDFDPEEKVYTANVDHNVGTVEATFLKSDEYATTDPVLSPHTFTLGDAGTDTPLDITVTAEDGETTERYTITVTRATEPGKNNDATLASLTLDGVDLNQEFDAEEKVYTANVDHNVGTVEATFLKSDEYATTDPVLSPHTFTLGDAGTDTPLDIIVTAEDGETTETYTITVTRATEPGKNNDATLASLTLDGVDLNQDFNPEEGEYTAEVGPSVGTIAVMWGTTDSNATTDPALPPHTFTLDDPGDRTDLTVTVTAEDGETTKTYNVEVKRAAANDDAHLEGSLTLKWNDDDETEVILAINENETDYTTDVRATVDEVEVMWKTSDKYATTDPTSPHTLKLDDAGETIDLDIIVTASDGDTERTYTLTVDRADLSNDANLASLTLEDGVDLNPGFDQAVDEYTANVYFHVGTVEATFMTSDKYATTNPVSSPHTFTLGDAGTDTPLDITVTAENGNSRTYTVTVTRMERPVSNDATLASLSLSPGVLTPDFDSDDMTYTAEVGPSVEEVTVTFEPADGSATMDLASPHRLALGDEGSETEFMVTVTAEDGTTTETYTIKVKRAAETDDATLGSLEVKLYDDDGTTVELNQPFDPEVLAYRADVAHDVDEVEILWKTSDDYATTDPAASPYKLKTDPDAGDTESLTITVTASDGDATETYTITVGRLLSNDATLSDLTVNPGILAPEFDPLELIYTTSVEHEVGQVTVTWEVSQGEATSVAYPPDVDGDAENDHQLDLMKEGGTTNLTVKVTAEDGTEMVYLLKVTRAEPPPNDNATLETLAVTGQDMMPVFDSETMTYRVVETVAHDVSSVEVTFKTADENATTDPTLSPHTFTLGDAGTDTEIEVTVTAEDGGTERTYTITVSRAPAPGFVFRMEEKVVSWFAIEEGKNAIYSVELATEPDPDETVTVTVTVDAGDGIQITGSSSLTFDATNPWNIPQDVEISSEADDNAQEEGPVGITHTGSSGDLNYEALKNELAVTLTETDTMGVTLSSTGIEFVEGEENMYSVVLESEPTGEVIVSIGGTEHGVTVNDESSVLLTFTTGDDWEAPQQVEVALPVNDDREKDYSAFYLTHSVVGADYEGFVVDSVHVKVMDDESPSVVVSRTAWSMDERGTAIYNIQLTDVPDDGEKVTVRLIANSGDFSVEYDYDGDGTAAVLDGENWNDGINVHVTAVDVNADVLKTLVHTVTNAGGEADDEGDNGPKYDDARASPITITVKDVPDDS